ncbi:MAG: GntR family transcriptional regulator [Ilumatobacteraceae bacterium]|nr:GntR family transcriptional regulator [Ilumatobacteraceae bacterium]
MSQLRQPRLADLVARSLRERIVDGDLEDGATLPTLDRLVTEFNVSAPSVREALRILESEGLITVRRGNVGGAVVHRPTAEGAAFTLGLVLQSRSVDIADVAVALGHLQALCARLCAQRPDRQTAVTPILQAAQDAALESMDEDVRLFESHARGFHRALVSCCGNHSLIMLVGTLEELWSQQDAAWSRRVTTSESPDPELRRDGLSAHQEILEAIDAGDASRALILVGDHCAHPETYGAAGLDGRVVRATDRLPDQ